jgi:hypothetical protein
MQNRTIRELVTWLIIASPLWWTSGCYTTKELTNPTQMFESPNPFPEIEVITKGNHKYVFLTWFLDTGGTITGQATLMDHYRWFDYGSKEYASRSNFSLPLDSIKSVTLEGRTTVRADRLEAIRDSIQAVKRPIKAPEITVTTWGRSVYVFKELSVDAKGNIEGEATPPKEPGRDIARNFKESHVVIPRDSISRLTTSTFSFGRTLLLGLGVLLGSCVLYAATRPHGSGADDLLNRYKERYGH